MMMHHHLHQQICDLLAAQPPGMMSKQASLNIYVWQVEDVKKLPPLLLQQLADPFVQMAGFR
jgi:hypothetical protein